MDKFLEISNQKLCKMSSVGGKAPKIQSEEHVGNTPETSQNVIGWQENLLISTKAEEIS